MSLPVPLAVFGLNGNGLMNCRDPSRSGVLNIERTTTTRRTKNQEPKSKSASISRIAKSEMSADFIFLATLHR
jgi:hypothetical protein